jgi:alcohol dehydrogenase class IV
MIAPFHIASTPNLHFGNGKVSMLSSLVSKYGKRVLLVTGEKSFQNTETGKAIIQELDKHHRVDIYKIGSEPSPAMIDDAVIKFHSENIDVVIGIGGGSVLDGAKAISAMLPLNEPVKYYLEGVGTKTHPGTKIPFIAIPTTSGTGSEATKNAVVSEVHEHGFKKSLRHNNFVPDHAILDPGLTVNTPPHITASTGMDAFTQLLEAYVSTAASSFTDAIAFEGLKLISQSLEESFLNGDDIDARGEMSLAAYYSGIVLANAGLGVVHGFASPIGGYFPIPHGVVCSRLMAASNEATVKKLEQENPQHPALKKYAAVGRLFSGHTKETDAYYVAALVNKITELTHTLKIPPLKIDTANFKKIVEATENKNNPAKLTYDELYQVLVKAV